MVSRCPQSPPHHKTTTPLRPPRSTVGDRHRSENCASGQESQRPYLKLLMPEAARDHGSDPEERLDEIEFFNYILFRGKSNTDWRSLPVFPDDDDDMDPPLSPLEELSDGLSDA